LHDCERRWALTNLTDDLPKDEFWDALVEKTLMPVNMLPGSILHDTIDWAMRQRVDTGIFPTDLVGKASGLLSAYEGFSVEWANRQKNRQPWAKSPGLRPVDEVYHAGGLRDDYKDHVIADLTRWLRTFEHYIDKTEIASAPIADWRLPYKGGVAWFWADDVPVYASYDFAMKSPDAGMRIYDWKTGKRERAEESVEDQLEFYAAWAHLGWEFPLREVECVAVWLDDGSDSEFMISEARLAALVERWGELHEDLQCRINGVNKCKSDLKPLFPMTSDLMRCHWCPFRSCEGRNRLEALGQGL
jgi:hypothetical protein